MTRINDFELNIAMKIAANRCLAADVSEFMSLDTEDTVVAPHVEKRVVRKLKSDEWKDVRRISVKALKYAVIALVSAVSLFFGVSMSIQPVRAAFFRAIVTWYEDYVRVTYEASEADAVNYEDDFVTAKVGYLPEGWSITHEHTRKGLYSCDITDSDSGFIRFTQYRDLENGVGVDNNVVEQEIIMIKDDMLEANLFILEDGEYVLIWKDKYMYKLEAENAEMYELILIAEGIK